MRDVLTAMIKAHEIQGVLALENSFNRVGLDHVVLVKVATTAVVTRMLGGSATRSSTRCRRPGSTARRLRTYRHAPEHRLAQDPGRPATPPAAPCAWR